MFSGDRGSRKKNVFLYCLNKGPSKFTLSAFLLSLKWNLDCLDYNKFILERTVFPDCFKATVLINSANHLPSRKRCKSKRSRNVCNKNDENILPSCYVSFENLPGENLKVTPIICRNTNPTWNYKCNVNLPLELLENVSRYWTRNDFMLVQLCPINNFLVILTYFLGQRL